MRCRRIRINPCIWGVQSHTHIHTYIYNIRTVYVYVYIYMFTWTSVKYLYAHGICAYVNVCRGVGADGDGCMDVSMICV